MTLKEIDEQFNQQRIFQKMTKEEKYHLCACELAGSHQYNNDGSITVIMGSAGIKRVYDYKQEMIDKYGRKRSST